MSAALPTTLHAQELAVIDNSDALAWTLLHLKGSKRPSPEKHFQGAFALVFPLKGQGSVTGSTKSLDLARNHVALIQLNRDPIKWKVSADFEAAVMLVDEAYFQRLFAEAPTILRPHFSQILEPGTTNDPEVLYQEALSLGHVGILKAMLNPPIVKSASLLWYQAKGLELIVTFACRDKEGDPPLFCSYVKRQAQERVALAKRHLLDHLDDPLDLDQLAAAAGCSSTYLSRTFSTETGSTLRQYHRALRVERAAQLMASGRCNVSEAAIEVGYTSFSHFTRAFTQEKGLSPSAYLKSMK